MYQNTIEQPNLELQKIAEVIDNSMVDPRSAMLESLRIRPTDKIEDARVLWKMQNADGTYATLGTAGNFSLFIGKAKARKSFLVTIAASMVVSNDYIMNGLFSGDLPKERNQVLLFDTEMSKKAVWLSLNRICRQTGIDNPTNLHVFGLRSKSAAERLDLIEYALYNMPKVGFAIIDGIRDLITSINDEEQASMITGKLMKWSEELNIGIVTVLHQNKGDDRARGHVGSELCNKAETVLSITKSENDPEISIVAPEQCRNKEPESFAFSIDETGLPVIISGFVEEKRTPFSKSPQKSLSEHEKYSLLTAAFSVSNEIGHAGLKEAVKAAHKDQHLKELANNKTVELIAYCKMKNWLSQSRDRGPYKLESFNG